MRRFSIIALVSFLVVIGSALFKKSLSLLLCGILTFNTAACYASLGNSSQTYAASQEASFKLPAESLAEQDNVLGFCVLGRLCVDVPVPQPVERLIEGSINNAVKQQLRSLMADEIPIQGSDHEFYETTRLPGGSFTPQTLYLPALPPDTPIPPGDYEIPVHFYCTKVYSFDGRGNRFILAKLQGKMAEALSALYARASYDDTVATEDIQALAWSMQIGMAYSELPDNQKAIVDELIPEYREQMQKSFIDQLTGIWNQVSRMSGKRIPDVNQVLGELGAVGDVAETMLRARQQVLQTNYSYQALAQQFAPQQDATLKGTAEETPWSKVQDDVYIRFLAPNGALDDGVAQVRVIRSANDDRLGLVPIADQKKDSVCVDAIRKASEIVDILGGAAGISEAGGYQSITASAIASDIAKTPKEKAEKLYELGKKHFKDGNYRSGLKVFTEALEALVDDPQKQAEMISFMADFTPFVGWAKGIVEAYEGEDVCTGEDLALFERIAAVIPIPGAKKGSQVVVSAVANAWNYLKRKIGLGKKTDDVATAPKGRGNEPEKPDNSPDPNDSDSSSRNNQPSSSYEPGNYQRKNESMPPRAAAYQEQVTGRPVGEVYRVKGVDFDGYVDGVLVEAKGPGYANFVKDGEFQDFFRGSDSLVEQAQRQLEAAGNTPIRWEIAEPEALEAIQNLFKENDISSIELINTLPR